MGMNNLLHYVEAKTYAFMVTFGRSMKLAKAVEQKRELVFRYAHACVLYGNFQLAAFDFKVFHNNIYLPLGCKLHRIFYQIDKDLLDTTGVTNESWHRWHFCLARLNRHALNAGLNFKASALGLWLEDAEDHVHYIDDVKGFVGQIKLANLQHTQIKKVIDKRVDEFELAHDQFTVVDGLWDRCQVKGHCFEGINDCLEKENNAKDGRPHFMAQSCGQILCLLLLLSSFFILHHAQPILNFLSAVPDVDSDGLLAQKGQILRSNRDESVIQDS